MSISLKVIPSTLEPVGAASLYLFPAMVQHMMSTMMPNLMAAIKISDMVKLVK